MCRIDVSPVIMHKPHYYYNILLLFTLHCSPAHQTYKCQKALEGAANVTTVLFLL